MSVTPGQTESFKVYAPSVSGWHINIYRMGYYQGLGSRQWASNITPSVPLPQAQPTCQVNPGGQVTGLIDCGNWAVSASWSVPSYAVSGLYIAMLIRNDTGGASEVPFVVSTPSSGSDIVYQTSDATWEAYNAYNPPGVSNPAGSGVDLGNSLYQCNISCPPGSPGGYKGAFAVSYNRPLQVANVFGAEESPFYAEIPMIEFLEQNGYNVSYISEVDTDSNASILTGHKVLISSGHDEYWSANMRNNVTTARNAGLNLAFFSGNEVFWKTNYAPDPVSGAAERTLVSYKETHFEPPYGTAANEYDPNDPPTWTGTWRDPTGAASGGDLPGNQLTGQEFMVNSSANNDDITVPAQFAKLGLWKNTSVATLTASSPPVVLGSNLGSLSGQPSGFGTLGYEWDIDADNGFRPAGQIDMSRTTDTGTSAFVTDYGTNVTADTTTLTHSLTLYRASSGALVFGAGTVQWSWGLDNQNPMQKGSGSTDRNMQQFTVNLFAAMGAQPTTLAAGLVPASAPLYLGPPSSKITFPANGATLADGSSTTISGTATDSTGGVVAGVEISTDGGRSWHPVSAMSAPASSVTWSYNWKSVSGAPSATIETRASDDFAYTETPSDAVTVTVNCPCSIFGSGSVPGTPDAGDASAVTLGVEFRSDAAGYIQGIRFYKASTNTGTHVGQLWTSSGQLLASVTFSGETASGWQYAAFSAPVAISAGTTYVASYFAPNGHYADDRGALEPDPLPNGTASSADAPPLHAVRNTASSPDGPFAYGSSPTFPTYGDINPGGDNYWVDAVFSTSSSGGGGGGGSVPNAPSGVVATAGVGQVTVSWTAPSGGSAPTGYSITPYVGGVAQAAVASAGTGTSDTITTLTKGTTYTFTVAATNGSGASAPSAMSNPATPEAAAPACPCTVFGTQTPAVADSGDTGSVNLGMAFTVDQPGFVTGVRFYKASTNTGTHVGSLWSSTGSLLAQVTFSAETASGWQQATFSTPVAVSTGVTYVVSYLAPVGHYSAASSGLASQINAPPLYALASSATQGNGVYLYGSTSQFPTNTYNATNYWVDAVFSTSSSGGGGGGGSVPNAPSGVVATAGVGQVTVSWTAPSGGSAPTGYSITPYVGGVAQAAVASAGTGTSDTITTLTKGTTYTFTVAATNGSGASAPSAMSNPATPEAAAPACPCTVFGTQTPAVADSGDGSSVNLGMAFTVDQPGFVTGVRFYKASTNTGTHVGSLWSSTGSLLAQVTFSAETASGWQQATFSTPVAVSTGVTYVVSYLAPVGHYSDTPSGLASQINAPPLYALASSGSQGNGVYVYGSTSQFPTNTYNATNYWVDAVFSTSSSGGGGGGSVPNAPSGVVATAGVGQVTVSWTAPAGGSAPTGYSIIPFVGSTAQAAIISSGTGTSDTITTLTKGTTYTFEVEATNGSGASPPSAMSGPATPESATPACPCTVFGTQTPAVVDSGDGSSVNLGMAFTVDQPAHVTGVRFYKASTNTGTHVGSLWSSTGSLLARVTFSGETASGWQQATFSTPVAVSPGVTYVVSYLAPVGHYSDTPSGLASQINAPPLYALASSATQGNGVYVYGSTSQFPTNTYNATNYWVDPVISIP